MADKQKNTDNGQLEQFQNQIEELTLALQRERADAINLRRRHEEEVASLKNHLKANIVREMLPIIDNFERSLKHIPEDLKGNDFIKGIEGIVKQFERTLSDIGVQRIKTVGEHFDPRLHEAVSFEEGDGKNEIVSEELQAGYVLGDTVVRHAMVKVTVQ